MADLTRSSFTTTGIHCRSCSMLVDMTVGELEGVESSETDHASGKTYVVFDSDILSLDDIYTAIRSVGYDVDQP